MATVRGFPWDTPLPSETLPTDGVSCLAMHDNAPASSLLACTSWDSTVRVWKLNGGDASFGGAQTNDLMGVHASSAPLLTCCFRPDDNAVLFGGLSNTVHCWQPETGPDTTTEVTQHKSPVKAVKWLPHHGGLVVSGSWDATLRFTDVRTPPHQPAMVVDVGQKVLAMDASIAHGLVVVTGPDRTVRTYDVTDLASGQPRLIDSSTSVLDHLLRSVALFPDGAGYVVGGIEGRAEVKYLEGRPRLQGDGKKFAFKLHRKKIDDHSKSYDHEAHAVNCIAFHPKGTFATCGGDGSMAFWDYNKKTRLKEHKGASGSESISALALGDKRGEYLAYASSYDWAKGPPKSPFNGDALPPQQVPGIYVHKCTHEEITPKN